MTLGLEKVNFHSKIINQLCMLLTNSDTFLNLKNPEISYIDLKNLKYLANFVHSYIKYKSNISRQAVKISSDQDSKKKSIFVPRHGYNTYGTVLK